MRIYEYAKQRNVSSKEVIAKLKELNINVSNHMVTIDEETIKKLDNIYDKEKKETPNSTEVPNNQRAINNQETGNKNKQKIKDTRRKRARAEETLSVARPMILTMKTTLFQRK